MKKDLTIAQIVVVAKDRAIDEFEDLSSQAAGYWNLSLDQKKQIKKIAAMIAMPDGSKKTLNALKRAGFVNGEEGMFYDLQSN